MEAVAIDHESAVLILQVLRLSREPVGVGRLLEGVLPHPGALLRRVREADPVVEVVGEEGKEGGLNQGSCFLKKRIIGFLALFITCSLGSSTSTRYAPCSSQYWPPDITGNHELKDFLKNKISSPTEGQLFVGVARTRVCRSSSTRLTSGASGASSTPTRRSGGTG